MTADLDTTFARLKDRFNPEAAAGLDIVFQFSVDDSQYHLVVNNGDCELISGEHEDPHITLIMDSETFNAVTTGEVNGMQAYMSGRLRAEGNLMLATRLGDLFSI